MDQYYNRRSGTDSVGVVSLGRDEAVIIGRGEVAEGALWAEGIVIENAHECITGRLHQPKQRRRMLDYLPNLTVRGRTNAELQLPWLVQYGCSCKSQRLRRRKRPPRRTPSASAAQPSNWSRAACLALAGPRMTRAARVGVVIRVSGLSRHGDGPLRPPPRPLDRRSVADDMAPIPRPP